MILTKGRYDLWEKRFEVKQFEVEDDGSFYKVLDSYELGPYKKESIAKSTPDIVFPGKRELVVETLVEDNPVEHLQSLIKEYFANLARFDNTVTYLIRNKSVEKEPDLEEEER